LDKTTTGLLFFSQSLIGAQEFSRVLQEKSVKKTYSTLLCGHMAKEEYWEDKIQKEDGKLWTKSSVNPLGKMAITHVFPLKRGFINKNPVTFAEIEILTGRPHQIRTVCAFHGFPLLGDTKYGGKPFEQYGKKLFLHATDFNILSEDDFPFPKTFHCPMDENFQTLITNMVQ
jgi:23S rRNA-/tRNA-specific pseudouridylate synthase